jgi:hypothetical protein
MSAGLDIAASVERHIAIHATAVSIGGRGLVIRGPSRAGKSNLALALIGASTPACPVMLVGDDRVLLSRARDAIHVAGHPRIAGLIEKRGEGILSMPHASVAPVAGVVELPPADAIGEAGIDADEPLAGRCDLMGTNFPSLFFVKGSTWERRAAAVMKWFVATSVAHRPEKTTDGLAKGAKD